MDGFHFLADSLSPGGGGRTFYFLVLTPATSPWYVDIHAERYTVRCSVSVTNIPTSLGVAIAKICLPIL